MDQTLLEVEHLRIDFALNHETVHAVKDVSFRLAKGQTLALVGESGSGKSVTAMSLVRLLPDNITQYGADARVHFDGQSLLDASEGTLREIRGSRIGMIFQEPMTSLNPFMRIGKQLGEAILAHDSKQSQAAVRKHTVLLLEKVGIDQAERRLSAYPHEFSGGQLQRIMIAMALINSPDLLIADEPTTALDVTIQADILDLLNELQQELGMAIIFITHDLGLAEHYADTVCVMKDGEIIEQGDIKEVFARPQQPYTQMLLNATPKGLKDAVAEDADVLLKANNITVDFVVERSFFGQPRKVFTAVDNISLTLQKGQTLGVVGESGSGKSTLGKAIMQMLPYQGEVFFEGQQLHTTHDKQSQKLKADRQIVFQDPFGSLSPRMTIGEIIGEGLQVHQPQLSKKARLEKVAAMLEEVSLSPSMINRYPHEFSGGQRQRIAIARAVILEPKFVLLDEPTSALDRSIQVKVVELLRHLQQKFSLSYIFISHDLAVVRAMSDEVIVMQRGQVMERGSADQIFHHPQTPYTQTLIKAAFDL
ncbi:ABC transporter ATP-binding protein [Suttonella sp. R2A3]|uniref:ABC transporter ATP-binding protein n=1 Tax=Suttonella sp. R2A3 TaxID=2908648 RepID=UPI001F2C6F4E|nr:ABC transporter ATP-binding protein [Suttonella sp. R2A3]UJF25164.1 ABC transporter ATP-binding protein [Suttonella sp. R2A3]